MLLIGFSSYLFVSTIIFKSANQYQIKLLPDAPPEEKAIHGDGKCNFNSNSSLRILIYLSFVPTIFLRCYGAIKYRKRDPLDF